MQVCGDRAVRPAGQLGSGEQALYLLAAAVTHQQLEVQRRMVAQCREPASGGKGIEEVQCGTLLGRVTGLQGEHLGQLGRPPRVEQVAHAAGIQALGG